jgi:hypothetical protein
MLASQWGEPDLKLNDSNFWQFPKILENQTSDCAWQELRTQFSLPAVYDIERLRSTEISNYSKPEFELHFLSFLLNNTIVIFRSGTSYSLRPCYCNLDCRSEMFQRTITGYIHELHLANHYSPWNGDKENGPCFVTKKSSHLWIY